MKKSILLPSAAVLVSFLAFFLRKEQLAVAKNPETLLFATNAPETIMLMVLIFGFLAVLCGFLLSGGRPLPNYTYTVYCPSALFVTTVASGSLLLILSFLVGIMDIKKQYDDFVVAGHLITGGTFEFPVVFALSVLVTTVVGMVMLFLGKQAYRGEELTQCWLTTIPAFLSVFRLINEYRSYGATPNFQESFYPIFGSMAMCLALYHLSATAYEGSRPRLIIFFSLASVVLTAVVVASGVPVYDTLVYVGLNLYMLAFSGAILENTYSSRENYRTPPPPDGVSYHSEG